MDRTNSLRQTVEAGDVAYGARAATFSPAVIEVFGGVGLDWVWLDFEHAGPSPWDSQLLGDLTRAADVSDVELLVRLPGGDPHLVRKVLDAGVRNVLVPRVETAEEVRESVRATRFHYGDEPGERGVAQGRVTRWGQDRDDYVAEEDDNASLGVMIENTTAVENVEEILAVDELGFVFVGPSDLSVSLGRPMEKDTAAHREHVERIESAALDAGVPLAGIANDPDDIRAARERGYRIIRMGGELASAKQVLGERLAAVRDE
jgi:2-dehydro-3-deoxyglucarate aldolase